jgi:DNA-binding transcriptional ArsR family regulator
VPTYDPAEAWDILSDRSRRAIFTLLPERPHAVGELADELPISRPAVSQHLRVLKDAGIVTDDVQGTRRVYRLEPIAVAAFRDQLDAFWRRALAGYQEIASPPSVAPDAGAAVATPTLEEPS